MKKSILKLKENALRVCTVSWIRKIRKIDLNQYLNFEDFFLISPQWLFNNSFDNSKNAMNLLNIVELRRVDN